MSLNRLLLRPFILLLFLICDTRWAQAELIADFAADLQPVTPKAGWSYLWNPAGVPITDVSGYSPLVAVPQPNNGFYYDLDGGLPLPRSEPAAFDSFDILEGLPGGGPGRGASQSADGLDHYAIAAYTINSGGDASIVNSLLTTRDFSVDGLQARIFVNDRDTGVDVFVPPGKGNSSPFDANLGVLNAGDTIYVAIGVGPGGVDFSSSFYLKYQIDLVPVPEPSSLLLFATGAIGLLGYSRARRRMAEGFRTV